MHFLLILLYSGIEGPLLLPMNEKKKEAKNEKSIKKNKA